MSAWPLEFFDYMARGDCRSKDPNFRCLHPGCYAATCTGHSLTARTERDPFERKVEDSFRRHAHTDGLTLGQLLARWGTTVKEQADKMRLAYETDVCPPAHFGCGRPFRTMKNGMRDMTFDRINPTTEFMPWNVQYLCVTCNNAKRDMPPARFAIRHRCWLVFDGLERIPQPTLFDLPI